MVSKRKKVKEYLDALKNPFSEKFLALRSVSYYHEQIVELCEELEKRYKFAVGTRVQMTENYPQEGEGKGWDYHAGHFLCTWNVGTVVDISHIKNGEIYVLVQWDFQPSRDGKKNEEGKYPWREDRLKIATLTSPRVPKNFKCPDIDRADKEKESGLKLLRETIEEAEKKIKEIFEREKNESD